MSNATQSTTRTRRTPSRDADKRAGERAHMLIWRAGRTQGDVAAELNIEPTAFGKKLRGKNGWALQELIDLAAALNTTVTYLIDEHGEEPTDDGPVGPAGIEPTTSTVESHRLAPVIPLFGKAA